MSCRPLFGCDSSASILGHLGVSIFFVLSGASLWLSNKGRMSVWIFFKKRFLAIYPLFWLCYVFVGLFVVKNYTFELKPPMLLTVFAMDGFLAYEIPNYYLIGEWYLGCQILLYFTFPFLRKLWIKDHFFAFLTAGLVMTSTFVFYNLNIMMERFPLSHVFEFTFGFYLTGLLPQDRSWIFALSQAVVSLFVSYLLMYRVPAPLIFKLASTGIVFTVFLLNISRLMDFSRFRVLISFLSTYSYGAFLLHHVIIVRVLSMVGGKDLTTTDSYLLFASTVAVTFALSVILTKICLFIIAEVSHLISSMRSLQTSTEISGSLASRRPTGRGPGTR